MVRENISPSSTPQGIQYRNNRPFTVVYFKKCTKKNGFSSQKSRSLTSFSHHQRHVRTSSIDCEPQSGLETAVPRMLPTEQLLKQLGNESTGLRDEQSDPDSAAHPATRGCKPAQHRIRNGSASKPAQGKKIYNNYNNNNNKKRQTFGFKKQPLF